MDIPTNLKEVLKNVNEVKICIYNMCDWQSTPQGLDYWSNVVTELNILIHNIEERISKQEIKTNERKEELCKEFEKKFLSLLETTKELGELETDEVKK